MFLSGQAIHDQCHWNLDDRYPIRRWSLPSQVRDGDRVFVKVRDIPSFVATPPPARVDLVVHNSDETFTEAMYEYVRPVVRTVYAVNCQSQRATSLPLGFRDHQYTSHDAIHDVLREPQQERTILCLVNFSLATNPPARTHAFRHFRDAPFATVQDYATYPKPFAFSDPETVQRRIDFYRTLRATRFAICPAGTGYDTHRVYECIVFGVIPVVLTSPLDSLYARFPVWIARSWSDVTEASMRSCAIRPDPSSVVDFKMPWE